MGFTKVGEYRQAWAWEKWLRRRISRLVTGYERCRREFFAWPRCPSVKLPSVEQLTETLAVLRPQVRDEVGGQEELESPIFLLSTGWRAGSTLLQRIMVTEPRLLLWGEPLGEMTIVSRIAEMMSGFISSRNLQLWKDQPDPSSSGLATCWIAILYPHRNAIRLALRSFFDQWLRDPARERGFVRWGFKEVRLGATEASLLHWLYPNAKFVIISRHPYDCYRSLADAYWDQVYYRYPDVCIDSAASFARHWNRLAISWSHLPVGFPAVHVKYEDLIARKVDFRGIESWLGIQIRENVALSVAVGRTGKRLRLSWYERMIIKCEAAEGMLAIGYR